MLEGSVPASLVVGVGQNVVAVENPLMSGDP